MVQIKKYILWDFDGTLARFSSWRLALVDVLNECEPGHNIDQEQIKPFLRDVSPWHKPEEPHFHLKNPDDWWRALEPVFARCYRGVGYSSERAAELAPQVRRYIMKPERYLLYEDALEVLAVLKEKCWRHIILSNHIPELPQIVNALGLFKYVDFCITSAATGYEKPNRLAFSNALAQIGHPEKVWLVGDNLASDVQGAEAMGIPAILVHSPKTEGVKYYAASLSDVIKTIENPANNLSP